MPGLIIVTLAFDAELLPAAKVGILTASVIAGGVGFTLLYRNPVGQV